MYTYLTYIDLSVPNLFKDHNRFVSVTLYFDRGDVKSGFPIAMARKRWNPLKMEILKTSFRNDSYWDDNSLRHVNIMINTPRIFWKKRIYIYSKD